MQKKIPTETFEQIVNKHMLNDLMLEPIQAIKVAKQIKEVAKDYTKDGHVVFGPETIASINKCDYDEITEMEKNPPFMMAVARKLFDPQGLFLAQYYVEPLMTRIMGEVNSHATPYIDINKTLELNIQFKTSDIIITNHMDIPQEFHKVIIKTLNEKTEDLNSIQGRTNFSANVLEKKGYLHLFSEQQAILAFQETNGITFGQINESGDYHKIREKYDHVPMVTDETSLIIIEKNKMVDLIAKEFGMPKAKEAVEQFLEMSPWTQFKVSPGTYSINFNPNMQPLKDIEQKVEADIETLFVLKSLSLDNEMKAGSKRKFK